MITLLHYIYMYMVGVIRRISLGGLILLSRERGEGGKTKKFRVKLRDTRGGEENDCKRGMNSFGRNNRERERGGVSFFVLCLRGTMLKLMKVRGTLLHLRSRGMPLSRGMKPRDFFLDKQRTNEYCCADESWKSGAKTGRFL